MNAQQTQANRMNGSNGNGGGGNEFGMMVSNREAMVEVASTRAAQEVQAAMVVAKKFPRDEAAAFGRVMKACKRKSLAEQALYAYPKGGQTVTGPSIRLAEMLAQNWGNVDFGIIELEQRKGESSVMSYAWDMETNTRQTKIFTVKHERHTRSGSYDLKDPREIYELTANQGARRLRACILGVIPGDVVDAAVAECEKTMAGNNSEPLADRVRMMLAAFNEMGVTQAMLEKRLGHALDATTEPELVQLKKVYRSLKDGMAGREDFFEVGVATTPANDLDERLAAAKAARQQQQPAAPPADQDTQIPEAELREQQAAPTEFQATEDGAQPEPPKWPAVMPDHARTSATWIDDAVREFYPREKFSAAHMAKRKFHQKHAPASWEKLDREKQDTMYTDLRDGAFDWA